MTLPLPARHNLEHLANQAKQLRKEHRAGKPEAARRIQSAHPQFARASVAEILAQKFLLSHAQLVIAREYGFESWPKLKRHVERATLDFDGQVAQLVEAAFSGNLTAARELVAAESALATADIWTGCVLGEAEFVCPLLDAAPQRATTRGGPREWEPLLYVCFSRFLGRDPRRSDAMLQIARKLLDCGADPNAFFRINDDPNAKQTALYGAAGLANHAAMTKLLLDAGADPNDDAPGLGPESLYHAAEFDDHECLRLILQAQPHPHKVSYCLGRKLDFDDHEGVRVFLEHGADPNYVVPGRGNGSRLHGAIRRKRRVETIQLLIQYGADLSLRTANGQTPYALAVRLGCTEAAELLKRHGASDAELNDVDRFLGACSRADAEQMQAMLERQPQLIQNLSDDDKQALPEAAMHGDLAAVRAMLAVGFDVAAAKDQKMTPLHWAAWHGNAELVDLLLAYDPPLEVKNMYGGTPLDAAVYGSVHCHNPQGGSTAAGTTDDVRHGDYVGVVKKLIAAGADVHALCPFPSGNEAVDDVLRPYLEDSAATEPDTQDEPQEPPVHEHVRALDDFFTREFKLPPAPVVLRQVLSQQADALWTAHARSDPGAAMVIRLGFPPAGRPSDDELQAEFTHDDARQAIARTYLFDSWDAVEAVGDRELDPQFESAVHAVVHGRVDELRQLLAHQPALVHVRSPFAHRATLLHYVSANGVETHRQKTPRNAPEIARMLLDAGADPDALSESYGGGPNQTALCLTASSHHPFAAGVQADVVQALLDGGATINGLNDDAMPLATALAFGYPATADLLVKRGARVDNLVLAAGLGSLESVRGMFDQPGNLIVGRPYVGPFGETLTDPQALKDRAFFLACKLGHVGVVEFLIEWGAYINTAPQRGETALHWAAYHGHLDVVRTLVEHGADTALLDRQWHARPIEWAAEGGREPVVAFLSRHAAPPAIH